MVAEVVKSESLSDLQKATILHEIGSTEFAVLQGTYEQDVGNIIVIPLLTSSKSPRTLLGDSTALRRLCCGMNCFRGTFPTAASFSLLEDTSSADAGMSLSLRKRRTLLVAWFAYRDPKSSC